MRKYEREFTRLLNCVPYAVRDERQKALAFEQVLQPEVYQLVHSQHLQILPEVFELAM